MGTGPRPDLVARNIANAKHGATRGSRVQGTSVSPLYRAWMGIKTRCYNARSAPYADYGGRGIGLHAPWATSFVQFRDDVERELGLKPSRLYSLDRIDNDGDYAPGNIRWATPTEQNRNQRTTRRYELNGEALTIGEWAERAGVKYERVASRVLRYGWAIDEALGTPPGMGRCPVAARVRWKP